MLDQLQVEDALAALGQLLGARGLHYEIVVIGGGGLLLLGFIQRSTKDVDLVGLLQDGEIVSAKPLPGDLAGAISDVGAALGLAPNWLNAGPTDLLMFGLPAGFAERTMVRTYSALTVRLAGRFDQICFKLYAVVDQGPYSKHVADLRQLVPAADELLKAAQWARTHDPSEGFRAELVGALRLFGVEDADVALG